MEIEHIIGKSKIKQSKIKQSKIDEEVSKILNLLKKEKQTYLVNKFVLEEVIREIGNQII